MCSRGPSSQVPHHLFCSLDQAFHCGNAACSKLLEHLDHEGFCLHRTEKPLASRRTIDCAPIFEGCGSQHDSELTGEHNLCAGYVRSDVFAAELPSLMHAAQGGRHSVLGAVADLGAVPDSALGLEDADSAEQAFFPKSRCGQLECLTRGRSSVSMSDDGTERASQ